MKRFLGYIIDKGIKAIPRKKKVSPTIKSVKPTKKSIKESVKDTKSKLEFRNLDKILKLKKQKKEGIKSARKASRDLQRAVETKRATKIGDQYFGRGVPPVKADLNNPTKVKTKKFKKGKEIEKRNESSKDFFETQVEKRNKASKKAFMGGGMAGRRMGYAMGLSVKPAAKKIKKLIDESKAKKQDEARVKKMGGGMMGRRFGYKGGKLVGKQKNIDVAAPFGKITGADFKKLRKK